MTRTTIKTLALVVTAVGVVMFAGCRKCSNCYISMTKTTCFKGVDTIFYGYYTVNILDSVAQREAEGYNCNFVTIHIGINNHPVCSKKEIES